MFVQRNVLEDCDSSKMSLPDYRKCFTFTWIVENISWPEFDKEISSPIFVINALQESKYYLFITKKRTIGKQEYIILGLQIRVSSLNKIDSELAFLSEDGAVLKSREENNVTDCTTVSVKIKDFVEKRSAYLHKDKLIVRCRIWKSLGDMTEEVQCFARTRICMKSETFLWNIKNFSSLHSEEKCTYQIKSMPDNEVSMILDLLLKNPYTDEDLINIQVASENSKVKYCILHLKPLNGFRSRNQGIRKEFLFSDDKKPKLFTLPFSKQDLLAHKDLCLPNDVLSFRCECTYSTGGIIKEIERVIYGCESLASIESKNQCRDEENTLSISKHVLNKDLKSLFTENIFTDIKLKTSFETFLAHKNILSARSPVFKEMFSNNMTNKYNKCVDIEDLNSDTVHRMLQYIYTAEIKVWKWEDAFDLYRAADKYKILSLRDECSAFLKSNLSASKVCDVLILADMYLDKDLKTSVQEFIFNHDVLNSEEWKQLMKTHANLASDTMHLHNQRDLIEFPDNNVSMIEQLFGNRSAKINPVYSGSESCATNTTPKSPALNSSIVSKPFQPSFSFVNSSAIKPPVSNVFESRSGPTPSVFPGPSYSRGISLPASHEFNRNKTAPTGTTLTFNPLIGTDTVMKEGVSTSVITKLQCITGMKEYENKTFEELRVEDYSTNRKGSSLIGVKGFGASIQKTSTFAAPTLQTSIFEAPPQQTNIFGYPTQKTNIFVASTQQASIFGVPTQQTSTIGAPTQQTRTIGAPTQQTRTIGAPTQQTGIFGAPTQQTNIFGATTQQTNIFGATTQQTSTFGTSAFSTPVYSFGGNQSGNSSGTTATKEIPAEFWGKYSTSSSFSSTLSKTTTASSALSSNNISMLSASKEFNFKTTEETSSPISFDNNGHKTPNKPSISFGSRSEKQTDSIPFLFDRFVFGEKKPVKPSLSSTSFHLDKKEYNQSLFSFGNSSEKAFVKPFSFAGSCEKEFVKPSISSTSVDEKESVNTFFSFGSNSEKESAKPSFSFASSCDKKSVKQSFATEDEKEPVKPHFSLGNVGFSFGSNGEKESVKPSFSLASSCDNKSVKQSFATGDEKEPLKPHFSLFNISEKEPVKPTVSSTSVDEKKSVNPLFSFGNSSKKESKKPLFSFPSSCENESVKQSFNTSDEKEPVKKYFDDSDKKEPIKQSLGSRDEKEHVNQYFSNGDEKEHVNQSFISSDEKESFEQTFASSIVIKASSSSVFNSNNKAIHFASPACDTSSLDKPASSVVDKCSPNKRIDSSDFNNSNGGKLSASTEFGSSSQNTPETSRVDCAIAKIPSRLDCAGADTPSASAGLYIIPKESPESSDFEEFSECEEFFECEEESVKQSFASSDKKEPVNPFALSPTSSGLDSSNRSTVSTTYAIDNGSVETTICSGIDSGNNETQSSSFVLQNDSGLTSTSFESKPSLGGLK